MSNDRDRIFAAVRAALAPLPERAAYPEWSPSMTVARHARDAQDRRTLFTERLKAVHAHPLASPALVGEFLKETGVQQGYVDPGLWEILQPHLEGFTVETEFDRSRVDDYEFGITRASGAIAETGTIILRDADAPCRLAALAPWVHVACVDPARIFATVHEAVAAFDNDPSIIFVTGPSKTADIEGILIEGVHGPGIQACCFVA